MPTKLRTATPDDIPAIIELQTKIWEPTYRPILSQEQIAYMFDRMYSPDALNRQMTEQGHEFILAETSPDDRLLGFASFSVIEDNRELCKLHKIYVLPETQGTGLGRQLLTAVEDRCREQGGRELLLNVNRHNKARAFYEKQGFQVRYEEDIPIGPYWMNDYVMGKLLV
ncbi:GCN5-related N-acetyltransferase [Fibrisoma limi BUZ 3]|uniref:GCN5-related N-acetyltransferase n=1 Tax=Fibrisoma limi BUZ 3 TaxID=1185876 RepID=I2GI37_9BACT|nr:GNAT family N-acetyltransferase [Fibrisoma limi]CCH53562.1 GCN5-related N-acetyltransferase [Fibrisoma limi BUZ 3]